MDNEIRAPLSHYIAYTDGAYSSSRDQGGVGIIILKDDEVILRFSKMYKKTTNNRMEMTAVILTLHSIKKPIASLTIYSDSMYVIGCATKGWKRNKNTDLWEKYETVYKKASELCPKIEFIHVKGHADNKYNNECDKLAVLASHEI